MVKQSPLVKRIDEQIRPSVESLGFDLVQIRLTQQRGMQVLQIMAEPSGQSREMTVEDCAQVSRHVSALLDVEDPISGQYNLEVSSPGIDRPLVKVADFEEHVGHVASVEMEWPIDGRKRFKGDIIKVADGAVHLKLDGKNEVTLPVEDMQHAKLVLTDALIKGYQARLEERSADA